MFENFLDPVLQFVKPQNRLYWGYILSAYFLAFLFYVGKTRETRYFSLKKFFEKCFPRAVFFHPSAKSDYLYFLINRIFITTLFAPLLFLGDFFSENVLLWFSTTFGEHAAQERSTTASMVLYSALMLLAFDFGAYLAHYLQHRFPILWEFHKVHHSAEVLTPITVFRVHPVDDLLNILLPSSFAGILDGVLSYLMPQARPGFQVFELNVFFVIFYLIGFNLRHTHVWLSYGPILNQIFTSPAQHQIHHSDNPRHFDKNMGYVFAFWDRLFGTHYLPKSEEVIVFGLGGSAENLKYRGVARLYFQPFASIYRRLWQRGKNL